MEMVSCTGGADPLHWCLEPQATGPPPHRSKTPAPPGSRSTCAHRHGAGGQAGGRCSSGGGTGAKVEAEVPRPGDGGSLMGPGGPGTVLVTGGGGYFGFRLGSDLASRGMKVILLDVQKPPADLPDGALFFEGDIRDYESLYRACEGVECVFHTASYGMSGPEQLRKELVETINVCGTDNVISACLERGVSRLVYTSTINVAFTGQPIQDGDEEAWPCAPPDTYLDNYSRTKSIADQRVRAANGSWVRGGGRLQTCVLRSSGIYGPGERRHLPRMVENLRWGFQFGEERAQMNWVHVDNLVMAHVLAADALTARKHWVASGQAYFINDGVSVNMFEWLSPLYHMFGRRRPMVRLPVSLVYLTATVLEYLHLALRPIAETPLIFTRNEVRNVAVSHTFKIDKARRDLGFCPAQHDLLESVGDYVRSRRLTSDPRGLGRMFPSSPQAYTLLLLLLVLVLALGVSLVLMLQ